MLCSPVDAHVSICSPIELAGDIGYMNDVSLSAYATYAAASLPKEKIMLLSSKDPISYLRGIFPVPTYQFLNRSKTRNIS